MRQKLQQVVASSENKAYSDAFQVKSFSQDIELICKELISSKYPK